jgi:hypothetical protein
MGTTSQKKTTKKETLEKIVAAPGRDDVHEQRESKQHAPGIVRKPEKSEPRIVAPKDPLPDPRRSTTNEDIERADGEGMAPVPPPRAEPDPDADPKHPTPPPPPSRR